MLHNFILDHGEIPNYDEGLNNDNDDPAIPGYNEYEDEDRLRRMEAVAKRNVIAANL